MSTLTRLKHAVFGKPIATKHAHTERLPKRVALPVFASDALSSVAYATEEIMLTMAKFGGIALVAVTVDFALAISMLIFLVAISYSQTIHAYPQGGGSYTVSKENLGTFWGELAGASLLIDYVLTVAVSVSAGVLAIVSLAPSTQPYIVPMGIAAVVVIATANLRGARESGALFSVPTYVFIGLVGAMIVAGMMLPGTPMPPEIAEAKPPSNPALFVLLILKAFSSGCTALTGIEAISNGTQAFREPVSKNASTVLFVMAGILSALFLGISHLASKFHTLPMEIGESGFKTVTAQIAAATYGEGPMFWAIQVFTAAILLLAANTAYADFPRLASLIARDGYLPRQLASVGDRLVYQNGIIALTIIAILLIVGFQGDTHKLIPLYAIGVFLSFTLSQAGMVRYAITHRTGRFGMVVSAIGAVVTGVVLCVVAYSKWGDGAYIVPFALVGVMLMFTGIKRHYTYLAKALSVGPEDRPLALDTTALLLIPRMHRGVLQAIAYAQSQTKDVRALHVSLDRASTDHLKQEWAKFGADMPLVILESPYRSLMDPLIEYIDEALAEKPEMMITVIVPQAVPKRWWQGLLHSNAAVALKLALAGRKNVVVTNVRYFLT